MLVVRWKRGDRAAFDGLVTLWERSLGAQEMSPALRDAYRQELDAMLRPPLTRRTTVIGLVLLVLLLTGIALIIRADLFYHVRGLMLVGHVALAAGFVGASIYILRDLRKRRQSQASIRSISGLLTIAAGILTVVVLMIGLRAPSDPKSLVNTFYVFVFYFACGVWGLDGRIASAELAAREQSLRIEYRLADLAERLGKS